VPIAPIGPAVFTQDSSGLAAAYVTRFCQPNHPVSQPIAIPSDDQAFLVLFGTGIRGAGGIDGVRVRIQGIYVPVFYAGPQFQFAGLDQVNVLLPPSLKGMGQVSVVVVAGGVEAAPVFVSIE